jgi:prepilin-type N-terminal cleavage/methylation domain-containing protein
MHAPFRTSKGFSLVEIIVAAAIVASVVTAVTGAMQSYFTAITANSQYAQAALLTEEGAEAIRIFRDTGWTNNIAPLSLNTPYYLYWNGTGYATSTSPVVIQNGFTRTFVMQSVARDSNDNISPSGGTTDTKTRDVTITVYASTTPPKTLSQTHMLIHNVFNN